MSWLGESLKICAQEAISIAEAIGTYVLFMGYFYAGLLMVFLLWFFHDADFERELQAIFGKVPFINPSYFIL